MTSEPPPRIAHKRLILVQGSCPIPAGAGGGAGPAAPSQAPRKLEDPDPVTPNMFFFQHDLPAVNWNSRPAPVLSCLSPGHFGLAGVRIALCIFHCFAMMVSTTHAGFFVSC